MVGDRNLIVLERRRDEADMVRRVDVRSVERDAVCNSFLSIGARTRCWGRWRCRRVERMKELRGRGLNVIEEREIT